MEVSCKIKQLVIFFTTPSFLGKFSSHQGTGPGLPFGWGFTMRSVAAPRLCVCEKGEGRSHSDELFWGFTFKLISTRRRPGWLIKEDNESECLFYHIKQAWATRLFPSTYYELLYHSLPNLGFFTYSFLVFHKTIREWNILWTLKSILIYYTFSCHSGYCQQCHAYKTLN